MVSIIKSNLLNVTEGIIGHQVNCKRVMGSGLAKQLRDKYPKVYGEYLRADMKLGECQVIRVTENLSVANLFGQDTYGRTGCHTSYYALGKALTELFQYTGYLEIPVHLPYNLGCGLAGGDWNTVYHIIETLANKYNVDVTIHKL